MRGGKSLAERGMIPRLLSGIYRRARRVTKESIEETRVEISLSYYEIYNEKLFDLFEAPEKRSLAGLPLRDNGNKAVVVGLTEKPCENLKDFEKFYDQANLNRSTGATKLNAVSSRSHAILGIKLAVITGDQIRISTASAIDLAGSEDNRRTENQKERMVESASINKSLFTLAKCVEAISRKDVRLPTRESKMTRILNIGQNKSLMVMILNLAPIRTYHQDTLSSLNFANRTKKIEVREIENEPVFKGCTRAVPKVTGTSLQRQPLRPLATFVHNSTLNPLKKQGDRQAKSFSVYSDKARLSNAARIDTIRCSPLKRPSDPFSCSSRPTKRRSPDRMLFGPQPSISKEAIEKIIEDKVTDILAARALDQPSIAPQPDISEEVQKRLELLEKKIDGKDEGRQQGLSFLLMAKQNTVRGEGSSALRMYTLAKEYFPDNKKLDLKIDKLREKLRQRTPEKRQNEAVVETLESALNNDRGLFYSDCETDKMLRLKRGASKTKTGTKQKKTHVQGGQANAQLFTRSSTLDTVTETPEARQDDGDYETEVNDEDDPSESDGGFHYKAKTKKKGARSSRKHNQVQTPRTKQLLDMVNARDISQIRMLRGVGAKKAKAIVQALRDADEDDSNEVIAESLEELGRLKGVGPKTVESMRMGVKMP